MTRVLIVEDDATINSLIYEYLTEKDFDCRQAFSGTEGRLLFDMEKFDLILLDLMIPGLSGEELICLYLLFGIKTGSWMNRPEVSWSREKESILPPMSWEL